VFEPLDFLARLAALVQPRPVHLTRYHGVFAPRAALRAAITPAGRGRLARRREGAEGAAPACGDELGATAQTRACDRDRALPALIERILEHVRQWAQEDQAPLPLGARAPPAPLR
jgi:hypothetical protein